MISSSPLRPLPTSTYPQSMSLITTPGLSPDDRRTQTRTALQRYAGSEHAPRVKDWGGDPVFEKDYQAVIENVASYGDGTDNLVTFAITTNQIDRANDRVNPDGISIRNNRPTKILWNHNHEALPIGAGLIPRVATTKNGYRGILMDVRFNDVTELARQVKALVLIGDLDDGSIGFIPLAWHDEDAKPFIDKGEAYPFFDTIRTYDRSELLEFSVCNIPMNPGATVQRGLEEKIRKAIELGAFASDAELVRYLRLEPKKVITTTTEAGSELYAYRDSNGSVTVVTSGDSTVYVPFKEPGTTGETYIAYRDHPHTETCPLAICGDEAFIESERKATIAKIEAGELSFCDTDGKPCAIENLYFQDADGKYRSLATGEVATPPEEYFTYRGTPIDPPVATNIPTEDDSFLTLIETFTPDTMDISSLAEKAGITVEQFTAAMDAVKEEAATQKSLASELAKRDAWEEIWDINYALHDVLCTAMKKYIEDGDSAALDNIPMDYADAANRTVALIKSIPAEQHEAALQSMGEYRSKGFTVDKAGATLNAVNKEAVKLIQKSASIMNGEINVVFENAKKLLDSAGVTEEDANPESVTKTIEDNAPLIPGATGVTLEAIAEALTDIENIQTRLVGDVAEIKAHTKPPLPDEPIPATAVVQETPPTDEGTLTFTVSD